MNPNFWKNKKVLLTGHTGFKGSWLSIWLEKIGANVTGFSDRIPTRPSLFEILNLEDKINSITGDIRDYNQIEKVIEQNKPEIIIHLAAQSLVQDSYKNPIETYSTNVMGTINVLEATRKFSETKVLINVTSDKCYKNLETHQAFKEEDPMGGFDPYSSSKGCAELVTASYRNSFFQNNENTEIATVRAGNVIGGGDWGKYRLIPDIFKAIEQNKIIKIRNPDSIRPWQHVLDPLNGYLMLAEKMWNLKKEFSEGWNFGSDKNIAKSVRWVVSQFSELWNEKISWEIDNDKLNHEAKNLFLDCNKAKNRLKWIPKLGMDLTLKWTIEWYQNYLEKKDMEDFTKSQIDRFESL